MTSASAIIQLPRGLVDETGVRHRDVEFRPLTGHQEVLLSSGQSADASGVSALLSACLARIGGFEPVQPAHAAALTRGDRHHALLRLRGWLLGERVSLVVRCANPTCAELADVDFEIDDLLPEDDEPSPETWTIATPQGVATFREPTGADDDAVERAGGDRAWRAALLWSRLVLDLDGNGPPSPDLWLQLDPTTRQTIALALHEGSRCPETSIATPCPSCGALMEFTLDPAHLLATELRVGADRLLAEVHSLAFHYHWSEEDILALPRARRWKYLDLLNRQLEGRPLTDWGVS